MSLVTTLAAATVSLLMAGTALAGEVRTRPVSFEHQGDTLAGTLYLPGDYQPGERRAAVLVTGAWTSIKEQMSGRYAREMAERGFVALAFDSRGWGQSDGAVRFKEDPTVKTADIVAAADFMASLPEVDAQRIAGLGICASAGYMVEAVTGNPVFASIALVAPWLHDAEIVEEVYGGAEGVAALVATSRAAEEAERAGTPQIITASSTSDETALMYNVPYYTEADRGLIAEYDNRFNLASWEPWLTYDSVALAAELDKPMLIVHSQAAAVPQGARNFFALLESDARELWLDDVTQFDFYDRDEPVGRAADAAAEHFTRINTT